MRRNGIRIMLLFGFLLATTLTSVSFAAQEEIIDIKKTLIPGDAKPIWVSLSGFTGEALQVLQNDLYVQGFNFTNSEGAQYVLSGSNNGNFQGKATDNINKSVLVSKAYSGASVRKQVHAFVDEFTQKLER